MQHEAHKLLNLDTENDRYLFMRTSDMYEEGKLLDTVSDNLE